MCLSDELYGDVDSKEDTAVHVKPLPEVRFDVYTRQQFNLKMLKHL